MRNKVGLTSSVINYIYAKIFTISTTIVAENWYLRIFKKTIKLPALDLQYATYYFEIPIVQSLHLKLTRKNLSSAFTGYSFSKALAIVLYHFDDGKIDMETINGLMQIINENAVCDEWDLLKIEHQFNEIRKSM